MTSPTPTPTPAPEPPSFKNAKADAKAAKAHAKALRPWYKKKRWILAIGFVLVCVAAAAGSSSETTSDNGSSASSSSDASAENSSSKSGDDGAEDDGKSGKVGQSLSNAGMTYEVTSARTASTIGDTEYGLGAEADGKFVVINLELTNDKDDTRTFTDSAAKVVTTDGKEYETTTDAVMAFGDESLFLKEVQPDLTTGGKLAFDLPPAKIAGSKLVIEDLFGRGEITVDLGL